MNYINSLHQVDLIKNPLSVNFMTEHADEAMVQQGIRKYNKQEYTRIMAIVGKLEIDAYKGTRGVANLVKAIEADGIIGATIEELKEAKLYLSRQKTQIRNKRNYKNRNKIQREAIEELKKQLELKD